MSRRVDKILELLSQDYINREILLVARRGT